MESKLKCIDCDDTGKVWIPEMIGGEYTRTVYAEPCHCQPIVPSRLELLEAALIKAREALWVAHENSKLWNGENYNVTIQTGDALTSINSVLGE